VKLCILLFLAVGFAAPVSSQQPAKSPKGHLSLTPDQIQWKQEGPDLWSSAIDGDPDAVGKPYSLLLKLSDGKWIRPHWHPNDKRVVVISGTLLMGMGDSLDPRKAVVQPAGTFNLVPAETRHYEGARGETVVLLYGQGPLTTTFVKPK
jgi:hypothetical protein